MNWHWHQVGVICPLCNEERKPTGSAYTEAIMIGGRPVPEAEAEAALAYDPEAELDEWLDSQEVESHVLDMIERKTAQANSGDLPPVTAPDDANSRKVLSEVADGIAEGVKNG